MRLAKALFRVLALVGKEITEVLRRPGAVLSLVLGPFLILAVFGYGYHGYRRDLQTIVVAQPDSRLPTDPQEYDALGARGIRVAAVTADRAGAEARLARQEVDLVVVVPANPQATLQQGRQAELTIEMNLADPVQANYASFLAGTVTSEINREIWRLGVLAGKDYAIEIAGKDVTNVPPEVIASPTVAKIVNLAPGSPSVVAFFGLAALALVLQHMAVTLLALSIVRERSSGAMDLFRVSPIRATELVIGKVLAFGLLGGAIAGISVALLVGALGVPILGPPVAIAAVLGLLLAASLGLGLLISVVSGSERQAVQLSMLTLLASMFFSGFVLRINEFEAPVQLAANLLPVTHGIQLIQDLFLRGSVNHLWQVAALAIIAAVLLVASWLLLRREMRPA
ncbi:MAG TPA: ABC transporter permease [Candidatus Acidoferrales bacterium]|nr:ABC transporter permease [Candidatus Acidoferrales bacterium]